MIDCNPSLLQKDTIIFRDSILVFDTIVIENSSIDTSFASGTDTVIIENDRVRIEYIIKDSVVYLKGTAKVDTVYREKRIFIERKIPVERIVVKKPTIAEELGRFGKFALILLLIAAVSYIIWRTIKKYLL